MRIYWWCSIGYYSNPNIASFAGEISNCSDCRISFSSTKKICSKKQNQSNSKQSGVFLHPEKINHISCFSPKIKGKFERFYLSNLRNCFRNLGPASDSKGKLGHGSTSFPAIVFAPAVFIPNCCYDAFTKDACTSTKKDGDYTADIFVSHFTVGKFNPIKILTCEVPSPDAKVQGCSSCPQPQSD